ncbi:hypothetical protein CH333_03335 [candidate division WOR-3 bacterium JGI_Cruoil_03_44_89]|uniref:HAD family hydrolase n=1 Tax=candidate division WOR-3 bacterium JGI_Cruoil_03_44_89 TaxID=1973748 RepID=A0A235BQF2_UNCW3|nr:MAG: hypothetical protein CH333_08080 [candidate division WOR-3 bacterium JGI_Cruoil_03_44_89]OYD16470.1 MAG: hypothetical protein CH333_03335 [candidate division WOR-3 bacterium JGI_Cruoil_03_44_89]
MMVIFFDLGTTLVYSTPSKEEVFRLICLEHGIRLDIEEIRNAYKKADVIFGGSAYLNYKGRTNEMYESLDKFLLNELGVRNDKLAKIVSSEFDHFIQWKIYPEVDSTLSYLYDRGYQLGIISNIDSRILYILRRVKIMKYFSTITYSQEVGVEKPDARIFQIALMKSNASPGESFHIGDNYEHDVRGALSVGMIPILIDREGKYPDVNCLKVSQLYETISIIERR